MPGMELFPAVFSKFPPLITRAGQSRDQARKIRAREMTIWETRLQHDRPWTDLRPSRNGGGSGSWTGFRHCPVLPQPDEGPRQERGREDPVISQSGFQQIRGPSVWPLSDRQDQASEVLELSGILFFRAIITDNYIPDYREPQ